MLKIKVKLITATLRHNIKYEFVRDKENWSDTSVHIVLSLLL
jgi:hypothetical protein